VCRRARGGFRGRRRKTACWVEPRGQEVQRSRGSRGQHINMSTCPEVKRSIGQEVEGSRGQEVKRSRGQEIKRSRSRGVKRSTYPHVHMSSGQDQKRSIDLETKSPRVPDFRNGATERKTLSNLVIGAPVGPLRKASHGQDAPQRETQTQPCSTHLHLPDGERREILTIGELHSNRTSAVAQPLSRSVAISAAQRHTYPM
jgi:hypothetical protein